jgi:hypothetical protein
MGRAILWVCASWVVALAAGCGSSGSFLFENKGSGDRVIAASLDSVTQSATASLTQLHMAATVNRQGNDKVVISSSTPKGARFDLVLTREKTDQGEKTRMSIAWAGARDDQTAFQVMSHVEAKSGR